ncbi:uncharacterized protein LTR77_002743 [Saxophila tyrrhenica]|uniref:ribonuclease H n=1 Tax=Saxophila tyrrhenica TaxID=1690608 RepID=A0AAV9PJN0_9PEZI|nr:hypothetical protein LTR77_002743 [Saxophila tyrrhenica]
MEGMNGFTSVNGTSPTNTAPSNGTAMQASAVSPTPETPAPTGTKRKRESKAALKFYAVRVGKEPGIYHTWAECLEQVKGFPKASFKSFTSLTDAQAFVNNEPGASGSSGSAGGKFYGVQSGRVPGWKGPKHKVFKTRMEAELFVAEGQQNHLANGDTTVDSIELPDAGNYAKKAKTGKGKKNGIKEEEFSDLGLEGGEYEPGDGPLPAGAEDNFDPTITLDKTTGTARYKIADEMAQTKYQASGHVKDAAIRIYTDGSALSNGQSGAIGGVGVYFGPLDKRNLSEPLTGTKQSNQRAELTAILRALEVAPRDRKIVICTDSKYAIQCCTEWFVKWRINDWRNASNKPVENKDLVTKIIDMLEERYRLNAHRVDDEEKENDGSGGHWARGPAGVKFEWVKGHAKDVGNTAADELAVNGARVAKQMGNDLAFD